MLLLVKAESPTFASLQGAKDYISGHLQSTTEAGPLLSLPGYLDALGRVRPFVANPHAWAKVGWDLTQPLPDELVGALLLGRSLQGYTLTRPRPGGTGWQVPKETVIPLPSELADVLEKEPLWKTHWLLGELTYCIAAQMDAQAVRVRVGQGRQEWRPAACLTLGFPHALNERGEFQPHIHPLTFPSALDEEGHWRTRDNRAFLRELQGVGLPIEEAMEKCGRREISERLVSVCRSMGIEVTLSMRFASQEPRAPHGATVRTPEVTILAGSVQRERRAEILAAQQLKAALGAPVPTKREIRLLLDHPGAPVNSLPVHQPKLFASKLNALGLVDAEERLLDKPRMKGVLEKISLRMEVAQVHLEACTRLPGGFPRAVEYVQEARDSLREAISLPPTLPSRESVSAWHREYTHALEWVEKTGAGASAAGRPSPILLARLQTAGLVTRESSGIGGRYELRLTHTGIDRLESARMASAQMVAAERPGVGSGHGHRADTGPCPNQDRWRSSDAIGRPGWRGRSWRPAGSAPDHGRGHAAGAGPSVRPGTVGDPVPTGVPSWLVAGESRALLGFGSKGSAFRADAGSLGDPLPSRVPFTDVVRRGIHAGALPGPNLAPGFSSRALGGVRSLPDHRSRVRPHRGPHDGGRSPRSAIEVARRETSSSGHPGAGIRMRLYSRIFGGGTSLVGADAARSEGRVSAEILTTLASRLRSLSPYIRAFLTAPLLPGRASGRFAGANSLWDRLGTFGHRSFNAQSTKPGVSAPNPSPTVQVSRPKIG